MMTTRAGGLTVLLLGAVSLGLSSMGCEPEQNRPVLEDVHETCVTSDQCPRGEVCKEGLCIIGDCVVREDCPKPNDQLCNELNRCIPDPDSPIGNECPNGDRDCDMGQFCSAGNCYSVAESIPCMRGTDCGAGERCDPINSFCVEDRGGCNRADEYPELACLETEACNAVTGHCEVLHGAECTEATQEEDCPPDLVCINERCVQCTTNESCEEPGNLCCEGFGTQCNVATGRCVSAFVCSAHEDCQECLVRPGLDDQAYCSDGRTCSGDAECSHLSDRRCATSTGECIQPECLDDGDCDGARACDPATLRCYLPPAECAESNEPNNGISSATVVSGSTYSDVLCRGDVDYLQLQGHANTRLRVTVGISPSSSADGISVSLLDSGAVELASTTFYYSGSVSLAADVAADAPHYLALHGGATEHDEFSYTVTIAETEPLQCDAEPGEPNETIEEAVNSVLTPGVVTRALCGLDDEDNHQLVAPANLRTLITVSFFDAEGDIDVRLMDSAGTTLDSSTGVTDSEEVRYMPGAADETVYLRVYRYSGAEEQEYTIDFSTVEPPTCDDASEPNDDESQAFPVADPRYAGVICDIDDVDFYAISMPGGGDITATLTFTDADGNLNLALREAGGAAVDTSLGYEDEEFVEGIGLDPGVYYIEVSSSAYSYPEPEAQPYELALTWRHDCIDDALEGWGNDTLAEATPLRDEALASFALEETLKFCGADEDWFRLILLGDELLSLEASGPGGLVAELFRETEEGVELVALSPAAPSGTSAHISFDYQVPGRGSLYYLRLTQAGDEEEDYLLKLLVAGDDCDQDPFEFNDAAAMATPVTPAGLSGSASLCPVRDRDLFVIPLRAGVEVTASASFQAADGDLDLVATLDGEEVAAARAADHTGPSMEQLSYTGEGPGELLLSVERGASDSDRLLPYDLTIGVLGWPAEDGGYPDVDAGSAGEDAGFGPDAG